MCFLLPTPTPTPTHTHTHTKKASDGESLVKKKKKTAAVQKFKCTCSEIQSCSKIHEILNKQPLWSRSRTPNHPAATKSNSSNRRRALLSEKTTLLLEKISLIKIRSSLPRECVCVGVHHEGTCCRLCCLQCMYPFPRHPLSRSSSFLLPSRLPLHTSPKRGNGNKCKHKFERERIFGAERGCGVRSLAHSTS